MSAPAQVALAGISGYGGSYLGPLLGTPMDERFRLVACADPFAERSAHLPELRRRGIPVYRSLGELYERARVDLTILATPIQFHVDQICQAVAHGSNVLCEKPLAATVEDAARAVEAESRSGRFVAVGYQWSFSRPIQALKRDCLSGALGRPRRFRSIALYPRGHGYYHRNAWAGRDHTESGVAVFDSPINNATAHFLHNMLYVLGPSRSQSAQPVELVAELYRANRIESFDTAVLRCRMHGDTEVLFATSHATPQQLGPCFRFEFDDAVVTYGEQEPFDEIIARRNDGRVIRYGRPDDDRNEKLWQCIDAARAGGEIACGAGAALPQTVCVHAALQSAGSPTPIDGSHLSQVLLNEGPMTVVNGLDEVLRRCYADGLLPSEAGAAWARPGRAIQVAPVPASQGEAAPANHAKESTNGLAATSTVA